MPTVLAAKDDPIYRFHPGIHFSRKLCPTNHEQRFILAELQSITGFELHADKDGNLIFTDHHFVGGSNTARELMRGAMRSNDSFTITATNHSNTVAFAQLESILRYLLQLATQGCQEKPLKWFGSPIELSPQPKGWGE